MAGSANSFLPGNPGDLSRGFIEEADPPVLVDAKYSVVETTEDSFEPSFWWSWCCSLLSAVVHMVSFQGKKSLAYQGDSPIVLRIAPLYNRSLYTDSLIEVSATMAFSMARFSCERSKDLTT